jgi:predicted O-linked N-acetylglucosamine transferase (SPINDLY family)
VLEIKPDYGEAHVNLGAILKEQGRLGEAEASYRRALEIKPDFAAAHFNLGNALREQGRLAEAEASYGRALEFEPDYLEARSNLLFALNYGASHTPSFCLNEAREYGRRLGKNVGARFSSWQCLARPERLRVGLMSGDMRSHPVGYFLEGLLAHIDSVRVELIAYPTQDTADELTARIRPHFAAWKPLIGRSDEAAARSIHADGVHVLLDLSGHTAGHRLPVFAWKPAPVQVSWLGYFATTGVPEMDYLLADEIGVPAADREQFTEAIWYLKDTRVCFTAPKVDAVVALLPALLKGNITFGCFQNLTKLGDEVLAVWRTIFAALPDAQLRLQCKQLRDPAAKKHLAQRLQQHGIAPTRVAMHGPVDREAYLAAHAEVDFILDTFPYPGGTTTCEALWMGVPTLTLAGNTLLARQGASLLAAAGLPEWVAANKADYVGKAIALASDLPKLAALRGALRRQVLESPLFDAPGFARNFEAALWAMWRRWQGQ